MHRGGPVEGDPVNHTPQTIASELYRRRGLRRAAGRIRSAEEEVRGRPDLRHASVGEPELRLPGSPAVVEGGQPPAPGRHEVEEAAHVLVTSHHAEVRARIAQPLRSHDVEGEAVESRGRTLVGRRGLGLDDGEELVAHEHPRYPALVQVACDAERQRHDVRHDRPREPAGRAVAGQLGQLLHVPPDLGDEIVGANRLLLGHLEELVERLLPCMKRSADDRVRQQRRTRATASTLSR
jgi:hypothetical protein